MSSLSKNSTGTRDTRSQKYQYLILECGWDYQALCSFPDESNKYHEQISTLRDQLIVEVRRVMGECLTKKQHEVIDMYYFKDMTQTEIAKYYGGNQSSVAKCLMGNAQYKAGEKVTYGGSIRKLRKFCHQDKIILQILSDIKYLSSL